MKTALVTGATSGFGTAICRLLAQAGYRVIGAGRRKERLQTLEQELGNHFMGLVFDIREPKQVEQAIASLPSDWKHIDLLVNNAGLALGLEPAHQANLDDWYQMVDTNIKGLITITRLVLPEMVSRCIKP